MTVQSKVTIRPYQPDDLPQVAEVEQKYKAVYPEATKSWLLAYKYSPTFKTGQKIVVVEDEAGQLVAHAHVATLFADDNQPAEDPHRYYLFIKVDPAYEDKRPLQAELFDRLLEITNEIRQTVSPRTTRLRFEHVSTETDILEFIQAKEYEMDQIIYEMNRDLADPISERPANEQGVDVRQWVFQTDGDYARYVAACNLCFPDEQMEVADLKFVMGAALSTVFAAFDGDKVVGGIIAQKVPWKETAGFMDAVFVLPEYRQRGLAHEMIRQGLLYLKEKGMTHVELNVFGHNTPAIRAYEGVGFRRVKESWVLGQDWEPTV